MIEEGSSGRGWSVPFKLSDAFKKFLKDLPKEYVEFAVMFLLGRAEPKTAAEKNIAADIRGHMGGVAWKRAI